ARLSLSVGSVEASKSARPLRSGPPATGKLPRPASLCADRTPSHHGTRRLQCSVRVITSASADPLTSCPPLFSRECLLSLAASNRSKHQERTLARKRRTAPSSNGQAATNGTDGVRYVELSQETRRRYLNYALSVITSRALPDVRDGLKPVQRRIM